MYGFNAVSTFRQPLRTNVQEHGEWFDIISAETPELLDRVFRLRYQIYCKECGYEALEDYPDKRETDSFDVHSVHSLLVNRRDDLAIGTVRLVLADQSGKGPHFPIQQHCPGLRCPSFSSTAEISRFAITKSSRKLPCAHGIPEQSARRITSQTIRPSIILGLMRAIVMMSRAQGISDWLAVMEPALLRHLARFGIYFQPVGPLIEYHGMRQPCQANIALLLSKMYEERPAVWEYITR